MNSRDDGGLFDYQIEMKDSLYSSWAEVRSVMCQMPTGTGKTHLLVSVVRDYVRSEGKPVWIVAHRIELVEQISSTLSRYGVPHGLLVGGGAQRSLPVDAVGERGFGLSRQEATAPENGPVPSAVSPVQVVSIQTLSSLTERDKLPPSDGTAVSTPLPIPAPGLLVIDEAHHSPARSYARLWELFPDSYKLGLTATPYRLNGGGFTGLFDRLLTSRSVSRFIEEGRLALFDYLSNLPDSAAQQRVERLRKRGADGDYSLRELGSVLDCPEAVEHLYECYHAFVPGKKGIIYAVNRSHSRHICDIYGSHGVRIARLDSRTPPPERRSILARYACGELDVLVNVDLFSEGFDCPSVEFIQLARPTLSLSKYLQQVGRGLRVHPCKVRTVILDQAGLYLRFGLPTEERDWERHFLGTTGSKNRQGEERSAMEERRAALDRQTVQPGMESPSGFPLQMGVVLGYGEFLRQAANRRASVEAYEQGGLYGLRKGDEVILPPSYPHIAPFVEGYAVVTYPGDRHGLVTEQGRLLPLPKCPHLTLYAGRMAYVEESPLVRYYLDLETFVRYPSKPEPFRLDFLDFLVYEGRYHLRLRPHRMEPLPSFRREELHIEGDLFSSCGILIHRSTPSCIYRYEYADKDGRPIVSDRSGTLYLCLPGVAPLYYGVKKWQPGLRRWKFVKG